MPTIHLEPFHPRNKLKFIAYEKKLFDILKKNNVVKIGDETFDLFNIEIETEETETVENDKTEGILDCDAIADDVVEQQYQNATLTKEESSDVYEVYEFMDLVEEDEVKIQVEIKVPDPVINSQQKIQKQFRASRCNVESIDYSLYNGRFIGKCLN